MTIFRPKTCSHLPNMALPVPPVRYFNGQVCFYRFQGPLDRKKWKELRKIEKNQFFRHFPWLDMDLSQPKTCSHWPKMVLLVPQVRYFNGQVCFYRFQGPLDTKYWKKLSIQRRPIKMRFFHQNENCLISAILGLRRKLL